jgi:hypothetical protein
MTDRDVLATLHTFSRFADKQASIRRSNVDEPSGLRNHGGGRSLSGIWQLPAMTCPS